MRILILLCLALGFEAKAFPGVTLEWTLGGGAGASPIEPHPDYGSGGGYELLEVTWAAEIQARGPWSVGARMSGAIDGIGMGRSISRNQIALMPYLSRRLVGVGPFELDAGAGLGWQRFQLDYSNGAEGGTDPGLPPDVIRDSPLIEIGATQRIFLKVIGLSVQEAVQYSFGSRAFVLRFAIPVGWRPRPGLPG